MATNGSAPKLVNVMIDGRPAAVGAGTNVVDAAHAAGVEIPIFCHHPKLVPVGMCRMCLVEVGTPGVDPATKAPILDDEGAPVIKYFPKLMAGCTTVVSEGMHVRTGTPAVAEAREAVLEFLLTSHPLDCPVCDKGGECPLQNLTMRYGPGRSRFVWGEKFHYPKPVPVGPLIALDRERCVLCARCIRFEDEIADDQVLGFENRGRGMEIVSFSDPPLDSVFSGNTTDVCPVGALTTADFRFESRVWELESRPAVCPHCAVGCNIGYDTRHGRVLRVMPREHDAVNEIWLCDKGRFGHGFTTAEGRLTHPLVRDISGALVATTWDDALTRVAEALKRTVAEGGPAAVGGVAGATLTNEDAYAFGRFLRAVVGTNNVDHRPKVIADDSVHRFGAGADTIVHALGAGHAIVVVGLDAEAEAPVLFLSLNKARRQGAALITLSTAPQKLDRHASHLRAVPGSEATLLAALVRAALEAEYEPVDGASVPSGALPNAAVPNAAVPSAAARVLADRLADHGPAAVHGVHPVDPDAVAQAGKALASAGGVLWIYGRSAVDAGLVPLMAAYAAATGQHGRAGTGLVAVGRHANAQGVADMGLTPDRLPGHARVDDAAARERLADVWPSLPSSEPGLDAGAMLAGGVQALYVLGTDPVGDDPALDLRANGVRTLIVQDLYLTPTAAQADIVLPAQSAAERDGTFTSLLRRVQRTYAAVDPVGHARADWKVLRDLAARYGDAESFAAPSDVFDEIARAVPAYAGLSYAALGPAIRTAPTDIFLPFAPLTEARSVSYIGTRYENRHGIGAAWLTPAEATYAAGDTAAHEAVAADGGEDAFAGYAVAADDALHAAAGDDLVLIPTAILFDAGRLVASSTVLHPLVPRPFVAFSPFDALQRGLVEGGRVRVTGAGGTFEAEVVVQDGVTPGTALAPESLGIAVRAAVGGERAGRVRVEVVAAGPIERGASPTPAPRPSSSPSTTATVTPGQI
ncbi:MAG: NADH-quinone oxidoreductase subunit NuoG [Ardenticatenales bacterium]|nr:NADH-quinone oxidoreductase subunit NuoG [Ardenticatenales bacterium]